MRRLYYSNEVRNFADIAKKGELKLSDQEIELRASLIENMSDGFNPEKVPRRIIASGARSC
jgi:non-homologous end joining protein Ku